MQMNLRTFFDDFVRIFVSSLLPLRESFNLASLRRHQLLLSKQTIQVMQNKCIAISAYRG
jgi:hypothetical protein